MQKHKHWEKKSVIKKIQYSRTHKKGVKVQLKGIKGHWKVLFNMCKDSPFLNKASTQDRDELHFATA